MYALQAFRNCISYLALDHQGVKVRNMMNIVPLMEMFYLSILDIIQERE